MSRIKSHSYKLNLMLQCSKKRNIYGVDIFWKHCTYAENTQHEYYCPSQIIVWGNYGRMDRKCFMGVARILLEELDLTSMVIGWYKLFPTSSMVDPTMAPLIRHSSQLSLESTVGPCCERS